LVAKSSRLAFSGPKSFRAPFALGALPEAAAFVAGFFATEATLFFAGLDALADGDFFAAGFDLAGVLEFFFFAELAINLGVALG